MMEITTKSEELLRTFILENYLFTDDQSKLSNADSFLDNGIMDSMGILELIYFLEDELSMRGQPGRYQYGS